MLSITFFNVKDAKAETKVQVEREEVGTRKTYTVNFDHLYYLGKSISEPFTIK